MYPELNGAVHFFCYRSEKPFWQNLVQTIKIWYLAEFGTYTNSNIQNSVVLLTFCVSDRKYLHRARSLVVSDLRSKTVGSRFESGCYILGQNSVLRLLFIVFQYRLDSPQVKRKFISSTKNLIYELS